uniref:Uncharacterized protein n=1 Tax=Meloidogyne enterolobii TaxID=390850 RepID=A0A6V7TXI4_MELEN|nr:unnamed protein product [Meloidogyne enterolobii]
MKFNEISIVSTTPKPSSEIIIERELSDFEFTLNDQLKEKWQRAIDNKIRLFFSRCVAGENFVYITTVDKKSPHLLTLPNFPKSIEEMIIIRFWLEKLFKCAFECACFDRNVFNPELINILFDNDKTIPLQFNVQEAKLSCGSVNLENSLKFFLNHLCVSELLYIDLSYIANTEQHLNSLFNILINEGNKFPKIYFYNSYVMKNLYDLVIKYIAESRDCSKMVPVIIFYLITLKNLKLNERAENFETKEGKRKKYTSYQICNPKERFVFCNKEYCNRVIFYCQIRKVKKETKIDVFKCYSPQKLRSINHTAIFICDRYEGKLNWAKIHEISIDDVNSNKFLVN